MKPVLFGNGGYGKIGLDRFGPGYLLVAKLLALDQPKRLSHLYSDAFEAIERFQNRILEEENYETCSI